jgi:hypothetical protein
MRLCAAFSVKEENTIHSTVWAPILNLRAVLGTLPNALTDNRKSCIKARHISWKSDLKYQPV